MLTLIVLGTCLPFVNRAYFVDDYYHMQMAKGLLQHPWRPYDFLTDDAGKSVPGWERGHWPRMVNPPLFHFMMAGVIKMAGSNVALLRTASLLFSVVALWCLYFLGKRVVSRPLAAASLVAVTPAYWLTSYSLLIDSALIAFFLAALLCFVVALEQQRRSTVLLAGLLMGLTLLVKYFGVLILPVALLWQWSRLETRHWTFAYMAYAVCLFLQLLWGVWNIATYGQMHLLATLPRGAHSSSVLGVLLLFVILGMLVTKPRVARYFLIAAASVLILGLFRESSVRGWIEALYVDKLLVVNVFMGGTVVFTWFALWLLGKHRPWLLAGLTALGLAVGAGLHSRMGGFTAGQSSLFIFCLVASLSFLWLGKETVQLKGDFTSYFLWGWLLLGLLELVAVMPWTAARYYLLILPPAVWIFMRLLDRFDARGMYTGAWVLSALFGAALAYCDKAQADTIKQLAMDLARDKAAYQSIAPKPLSHWYYLADTFDGSQPYLEPLGWENVFPHQAFRKGDLFLRSRFRKSSWWEIPHPERFRVIAVYQLQTWLPLRVMDVPASAGFYASCWGALPYAFTRDPLERFELSVVTTD